MQTRKADSMLAGLCMLNLFVGGRIGHPKSNKKENGLGLGVLAHVFAVFIWVELVLVAGQKR